MATTYRPHPPGPQDAPEVELLPSALLETPPAASEQALSAALVEAPPPRLLSVREVMEGLPGLIEQARESWGAERSTRTRQLNQHLEALASEGGSREAADVLLRLLESGQLEDLSEKKGRTCRSVAVETLLRLGFPYALEVRPEDLEHLRDQTPHREGQRISPKAGAASLMGLGLFGEWLTFFPEGNSEALPVFAMMGMQLLGMMAALLGAERSDARLAGLWVLALLSVAQLLIGLAGGFYPGMIGGGAGLLAWLLLWLPRR